MALPELERVAVALAQRQSASEISRLVGQVVTIPESRLRAELPPKRLDYVDIAGAAIALLEFGYRDDAVQLLNRLPVFMQVAAPLKSCRPWSGSFLSCSAPVLVRITAIASGTDTPLDKAAAIATVITADDIAAMGAVGNLLFPAIETTYFFFSVGETITSKLLILFSFPHLQIIFVLHQYP